MRSRSFYTAAPNTDVRNGKIALNLTENVPYRRGYVKYSVKCDDDSAPQA